MVFWTSQQQGAYVMKQLNISCEVPKKMASLTVLHLLLLTTICKADIANQRDRLQNLVGPDVKVTIESFVAGTTWVEPILAVRPTTLQQVQAVVKGCHQLALRVRAAGSQHSRSPIFADAEQVYMFVKDIQRHDGPQIELYWCRNIEPPSYVVTLMAGVTVGEFRDFQLENNIEFPCTIEALNPTLGGIVAVSAHGFDRDCSSSSDQIVRMRVVDSEGNLHTFSRKKDGPEMMRAIKTSLGLFGIIFDISLKVKPLTKVEVRNIFSTVSVVFNEQFIEDLYRLNEGVVLQWLPFTGLDIGSDGSYNIDTYDPYKDSCWIQLTNRLGTSLGKLPDSFQESKQLDSVNSTNISEDLVLTNPELTPVFVQQHFHRLRDSHPAKIIEKVPIVMHHQNASHGGLDFSWGFDAGQNFRNIIPAAQAAFSFPGAVPHWAKMWSHEEGINEQIREGYDMNSFLDQLHKSGMDPDGIFLNDRLEQIFFPGGHTGWETLKASRS